VPKVSPEYLAARRQQILDAALVCFDRAGFHRTSMQDIFDQAGLSTGAVYRYFDSKEAIVEAIAEQRHAREAELISEALEVPDPRQALHRLADLYFGWLEDPAERQRRRIGVLVWAEAVHHAELRSVVLRGADQRQLLNGYLQLAKERGALAIDTDSESITRVFLALFQGFILQQAWDPDVAIGHYLTEVHRIIDSLMPSPTASTFEGESRP
jgi:AcrR family transcriptional regulator